MLKSAAVIAKHILFGTERRPRRIRLGLYRGVRMDLDPNSQSQLMLGLAERETHRYVRRGMRVAKWGIDVGAGEGELSILLAAQPNIGQVIAVEPGDAHERLLRNIGLNDQVLMAKIVPLRLFVGTRGNASLRPLDALPVDRNSPGFIKIDVDGAEMDVLQSGKELLAARQSSVLVETHSPELEVDCNAFLKAAGYLTAIVRNAPWRTLVPETRPTPHNRWLWAQPA